MPPNTHVTGPAQPCPSTRSASTTSTAPLDVRETIAFQPDAMGHALRDLLGQPKVKEAAILSTCNRTEVYVRGAEPEPVVRWLEDFHHVPKDSLAPYIYTLPREHAITHAFRVASGLDSMVLGEPQILGQMKQAVRQAESAGTLGLVLNRLFQRTFAVAKDVRTNTDIGSASISMAAASVKLAERIFPSISGPAPAADRRRRDDRADGHAFRGEEAEARSRSPTARSSAARSSPRASAPTRSR